MSIFNIDSIVILCILLCTNIFELSNSLKSDNIPCKQQELLSCKCIFPSGRGINLDTITQTFRIIIPEKHNTTIILHLCENISIGTNTSSNQCFNNVSVCLEDPAKNQSVNLGTAQQMKIVSENQDQPMKLQFDNDGKITNIALACVEDLSEPNLLFKGEDGTTINLELQSKESCVRQLSLLGDDPPAPAPAPAPTQAGFSVGSRLVLLVFIGTFVYLVGGMLTLKYMRGAVGWEMVPNIEFWMDLPFLVRDGILFTLNGFRPQESYDRI